MELYDTSEKTKLIAEDLSSLLFDKLFKEDDVIGSMKDIDDVNEVINKLLHEVRGDTLRWFAKCVISDLKDLYIKDAVGKKGLNKLLHKYIKDLDDGLKGL